ncbi:hypothetical protein N8904_01850 [Flavobacteriales bacterium]|nr:hypothetical protein [Flavobacteriales bacterium]
MFSNNFCKFTHHTTPHHTTPHHTTPHHTHFLVILSFLIFFSFSVYGQVMILSADDNCYSDPFEFTNCTYSVSPDGWIDYIVSPDCAAARQAILYPVDPDDEGMVLNEAAKRNISSLGLTAGTPITVSLTVGASNYSWGTVYDGTHTFEIRVYNSDPGYYGYFDLTTNNLCLNGGQIILSGANTTTTGITFTATTTLTQNANWIAIGSCPGQYGTGGSRGIVFDDLEICW